MKLVLDVEEYYHVNMSNLAWHARSSGVSLPRLAKHCQFMYVALSMSLEF